MSYLLEESTGFPVKWMAQNQSKPVERIGFGFLAPPPGSRSQRRRSLQIKMDDENPPEAKASSFLPKQGGCSANELLYKWIRRVVLLSPDCSTCCPEKTKGNVRRGM